MRKLLITAFVLAVSAIPLPGAGDALAIDCSDCHTMHDSQNGVSLFGAPNNNLLSSGCVGCHTASDGQKSTNNAPAILHTIEPPGQGAGKTLASGDFYWINADEIINSAKGHNVIDLAGVTDKDANMPDFNPPGWDPDATGGGFAFGQVADGETTWSSQLACAGRYGCHGKHSVVGSFEGIRGAHHSNTDGSSTRASAPTTIGGSYRFLAGIKGMEDPGWNWNETPATHNEYYGENNTTDRSSGALIAYGSRDTISYLCSECHGLFHSIIDSDDTSGAPWIRHPTDITLPGSGEYALYNTGDGTTIGSYSLEAPVARNYVPESSSSTVVAGTDIIMCMSCHRAHGSNQDDLLRWNYSEMVPGGSNTGGCFTCHTAKNAAGVNP